MTHWAEKNIYNFRKNPNANSGRGTSLFTLLDADLGEKDPLSYSAAVCVQRWFMDRVSARRARFFAAAEFGLSGILSNCIKKRQNVNEACPNDLCDLKRPALHIAAGAGHTEAVRLLLDNGASALVPDVKGMTALHYASQNTPEALHKMQNTANSNTWKQSYVTGDAPSGCLEIVRMLVRRQPKTVEAINTDGQTALHLACSHGLHTVATVLLCEGDADPDIRDGMNRCALHLSAWRGDYEVTRVLLEHSEESEALYARNAIGRTPLHVAAVYGHTRVARLLLEAGAPHDVINNNGNTPLHLSLLDGFWETADLLLDYGAETHLPNCNGETAIWIAVEKKQSQLALKMLDKRRIIRNSVGLFGYSTEITYDMRALDAPPERVAVGYDYPGVGEVHPFSQRVSILNERLRQDTAPETPPSIRPAGLDRISLDSSTMKGSTKGSAKGSKTDSMRDSRTDSIKSVKKPNMTIVLPSELKKVDVLKSEKSLESTDKSTDVTKTVEVSRSPEKTSLERSHSNHSNPQPPSPRPTWPSPDSPSSSRNSSFFFLPLAMIGRMVTRSSISGRGSETPTIRRKGSLRASSLALEQTTLRRIASTSNKELISHPVVIRLLEWQWQKFARRVHMRHLLNQVVFTLLWTICTLIGGGPWGSSQGYSRPDFNPKASNSQGGGAQMVFTALMVLMMLYMFGGVLQRELSSLAIEVNSRLTVGGDASFKRGLWKAFLSKHDFWFVYDLILFGIGTILVLVCMGRSLADADCPGCWEMTRVVYGIISVFVWARFLQFFSSNRRTGPFIKVIAVMFQKDIRNFFTIYFVVLLAFSHGFFILLTGLVSNKIDADQYATTAFDNPVKTVMAVYRLMLGDYQSMYERYETIPSDAVVISTTIMYFAYMTFANVLMLNLLIAMLDETYTEHKREMEKEWRLQWAKRILTIEDSLALDEDHRVPDYIEVTKDDLASEMKHQAKSALEQRMSGIEENLMQTNALLKAVLNRMDVREEREREMALVGRRSSLVIPSEQAHPTMATFSRGPRSVKSHTSRKSSASRQTNSMVKTPVSSNPAEVSYNGSSGSLFALALEEIERSNRIGVMESFAGVEPHTDDPISRYLEDQMLAQRVLETNEALADLEKDMQMENMDDLVAGIESGGRGPPPFMLPGTAF